MRAANVETIQPRYRAETKEELKAFLEREAADESYTTDDRWGKVFKKDGPLEWFNPPWDHDDHLHFQDVKTEDDWAASAREQYRNEVMSLPLIP